MNSSDNLSILKVTSNTYLADKVTKAIGNEYNFFNAEDLQEAKDILEKEKIDFIYLDFDSLTDDYFELIEIIKSNKDTAKNPIIVFASTSTDEFRESIFSSGANELLVKPFFEKEIHESFHRAYGDSGQFNSSFTGKLIDSTVKLFNCEELSFLLENRAKVYCRENQLDIQTTKDISNLAKYISIGIESMKLEKLKSYFCDLDLAVQLQKILLSHPNENRNSAILYSLYEQERIFHSLQESQELEYGEFQHIYDELLRRYFKDSFNIYDFLDFKYMKSILKDKLEKVDSSNNFLKIVEKTVKHTLLYCGGSIVTYLGKTKTIKIYPQNNKTIISNEKLEESVQNSNIEIKKATKRNTHFYKISLLEEKIIELEEEDEFIDFSFEEEAPKIEKRKEKNPNILDAITYLENNSVDFEDISVMEECEYEISEILDVVEYSDAPGKYMKVTYDIIHKYANRLIYYIEFQDISDSLILLADTIRQNADDSLDNGKILNAFALIDSIIRNLKIWRTDIFVEQCAEDIHFLDDSIKADCQQLIFFLTPITEEAEEDSLEFF